METTFDKQCEILSDLWLNYKGDVEFETFIQYNDLGLPLAYAVSNGIVEPSDKANNFISETFSLLLAGLDVEDSDYQSLDDLLEGAAKK
jgi:hypothetical protein